MTGTGTYTSRRKAKAIARSTLIKRTKAEARERAQIEHARAFVRGAIEEDFRQPTTPAQVDAVAREVVRAVRGRDPPASSSLGRIAAAILGRLRPRRR